MSINTSNLVVRPFFSRKMVAFFCLMGFMLLPIHKAFSAGTMEYYHYDSHGSLLDVYGEDTKHILSQRWSAWGEREVISPSAAEFVDDKTFLPSKNIPVYLGYKGAKMVADDSLVLFGGSKVYSPRLKRMLNTKNLGTAGDNQFSHANNNPLNEDYQGPEGTPSTPKVRSAAFIVEAIAAGAITLTLCYAQPELCSAAAAEALDVVGTGELAGDAAEAGITLAETTNLYGFNLMGVGGFAGMFACPIAYGDRSDTKAAGWCAASISAIHTGARILLSYRFSGKLGAGNLKMGFPTLNQALYGTSFTIINSSASIASMALGEDWASFSRKQKGWAAGIAIGISFAQAVGDMYTMRWLEGFGAFRHGEDVATTPYEATDPWSSLREDTSGVPHHMVRRPRKWASRIGEVVLVIGGVDLAAAANKRQRLLTWKEVRCQIFSTILYQGTRVAVANTQDGATWGRAPGAFASGVLGNTKYGACAPGTYDSFF